MILWEYPNLNSPLWDTGKVLSQNSSIEYAGAELHSGRGYYWKVRWWDHKGEMVESEEVGHFMTGILDPTDWTPAKWLVLFLMNLVESDAISMNMETGTLRLSIKKSTTVSLLPSASLTT